MTPPLPQLTAIAAIADRFPDGSYGATVNVGADLSFSLTAPRARRYAVALIEAATACEHDAALYHALTCKSIPQDYVAAVLNDCRAARPGVNRWTAPLRISSVLTAAEPHLPVLVVQTPSDDGWQWAPADARRHARHVLEAVTAAEEDNRLAGVLRDKLGLEDDVVAAVIDHLKGHWPDDEDQR
jgi:hypothetical protein